MEEKAIVQKLPQEATASFLQMLGLAARARRLGIGATIARDAMRTGSAVCVVLAADASANTQKRILDTASFYKIPIFEICKDAIEIGQAIGKSGMIAAVAVLDASFASALQGIYEKFTSDLLEV